MRKDNAAQMSLSIIGSIRDMFPAQTEKAARMHKDAKCLTVSYNDLIDLCIKMFLIGKAWTD